MIRELGGISFILFGLTYLLSALFHANIPIARSFHRFNTALVCIVSSLGCFSLFSMKLSWISLAVSVLWIVILLGITYLAWERDRCSMAEIVAGLFFGLAAYSFLCRELWPGAFHAGPIVMSILGGWTLSGVIYAMNLGHWYLNVHKLPVIHLVRTVKGWGALLALRVLLNIGVIALGRIFINGDSIRIWEWMMSIDGITLWIALLFGIVSPLILVFLVLGTLRVKSTQSATGILYVGCVSLLIGELCYKYFFVRFGIGL